MTYNKTTWKTGDIITADKLNNIENGIQAVELTTTNGITQIDSKKQNKLVAGTNITLTDNPTDNTTTISAPSSGGINNPLYPSTTPSSGDQTRITSIKLDSENSKLLIDYDYTYYESGSIEDTGTSTLQYPKPVNIANTSLNNLAQIAFNNMFIGLMPDYSTGIQIAFTSDSYTVPYDGIIIANLYTKSSGKVHGLIYINQIQIIDYESTTTASSCIWSFAVKEGDIVTTENLYNSEQFKLYKLRGGSY